MECQADLNDRIVRLSSWTDMITVSGEWRSEQYSWDVVERYLHDVVDFILLLLGDYYSFFWSMKTYSGNIS